MDNMTHEFYNARAAEVAQRYESDGGAVSQLFPDLFHSGQSALDIGAGSGRDMAQLHALGMDAWGLEPSDELQGEAIRYLRRCRRQALRPAECRRSQTLL